MSFDKNIRLAVFRENYWDKGLIYTQNIMPLKKMADNTGCKMEIISFTSIYSFILNYKKIRSFTKELKQMNVFVTNFPILYIPTRFMLTRWFMKPFYNANVWIYIKYLDYIDSSKDVVYNLRSYEMSLGFLEFYTRKDRLFFDTRTDWIEENINAGNFKKDSKTVRFWNRIEGKIIGSFNKTFVISDIFKNNLIQKHGEAISDKIEVIYNPIDYKHFSCKKQLHEGKIFLYTGSFGQWNRIENYLDFFKKYHDIDSDSHLIICTSTAYSRINPTLNLPRYKPLKDCISINYSIKFEDLPFYYAKCDYGLQLMNKKDSRVGVKFIEYIASGLVPIVSSNVQGAAYLAEKFGIGIVLHGDELPQEIVDKVEKTSQISKESNMYLEFKSLTDINSISKRLEFVFFNRQTQ